MSLPWRSRTRSAVLLLTLPFILLLTSAQSKPAWAAHPPRSLLFDLGPLTKQQRADDFDYLTSIIEEQYAPLQLKEKIWGFQWKDLKSTYRERALRDRMSHAEFGTLMREFVANLHDAHTHLIHYREAVMNGLSARASTLGFFIERRIHEGSSTYVVSRVVPNFFRGNPPVQKDDIIVAIDDRTPTDIIREDLAPLGTTGREDSDASVLAGDLTMRFSPMYTQRPSGTVKVTIKRGDLLHQVSLAWVDADLRDLRRALQKEKSAQGRAAAQDPLHAFVTGRDAQGRYMVSVDQEGSFLRLLRGEQGLAPVFRGQYFAQPQVMLAQALKVEDAPKVPAGASEVVVEGLPFHVFQTPQGLAASYRVEDFMWSRLRCDDNPDAWFHICEPISGEEYATAFATLARNFGVKNLILDLRNNGGGALAFSDELLRAFGPQGLQAMLATVRLNETWLGTFAYLANDMQSPIALRASYKTQEELLRHDLARGERLSSPVYILGDTTLAPNLSSTQIPGLHVLINESCASACDMFAAAVQDQKLGRIIGRRSMGAGGNVVFGGESPHERFMLTQTASLAYRADGSFVENQGVTPDVPLEDNDEQIVWQAVMKSFTPSPDHSAPSDTGAASHAGGCRHNRCTITRLCHAGPPPCRFRASAFLRPKILQGGGAFMAQPSATLWGPSIAGLPRLYRTSQI